MELITWGFFLKVCVADNLGPYIDTVYSNSDEYGAVAHTVSSAFFSFQIYADFFGYSSIAIGLGRILGFDFGINFNRPYLAVSLQDFWRRWHISLSTWLRDYLYISLGGSRNGSLKTYRNILLTMVLGGIWHGANWTFFIWGLIHGCGLVIERVCSPDIFLILQRLRAFGVSKQQQQQEMVFQPNSLEL